MKILSTKINGLKIIKTNIYKDKRGFLKEVFRKSVLNNKDFPFDIMSYSKKNVLRGLHLQALNSQGKYVSVIKGKIFDVCVDLRKKSKTFGKYFSIILSEKNSKSIYIPPGFAHGFCTLDKENYIIYSCTKYRDANSETTLQYKDKTLNIKWPLNKPIISKKDKLGMSFEKFIKENYGK